MKSTGLRPLFFFSPALFLTLLPFSSSVCLCACCILESFFQDDALAQTQPGIDFCLQIPPTHTHLCYVYVLPLLMPSVRFDCPCIVLIPELHQFWFQFCLKPYSTLCLLGYLWPSSDKEYSTVRDLPHQLFNGNMLSVNTKAQLVHIIIDPHPNLKTLNIKVILGSFRLCFNLLPVRCSAEITVCWVKVFDLLYSWTLNLTR